MDEVLETSDYVTIHVPLNNETRGLISERMLAKLRARLSYGNVVATLALFLSLGGGAYALSPQATTSTPGPVPHDGIVFFKKNS